MFVLCRILAAEHEIYVFVFCCVAEHIICEKGDDLKDTIFIIIK
jgi:hypothetical protein